MGTRPSCWTDGEATARAPAFYDRARSCSFGWNPLSVMEALGRGCRGCSRLRRGVDIAAGVALPDKPVRRVRARTRRVVAGG